MYQRMRFGAQHLVTACFTALALLAQLQERKRMGCLPWTIVQEATCPPESPVLHKEEVMLPVQLHFRCVCSLYNRTLVTYANCANALLLGALVEQLYSRSVEMQLPRYTSYALCRMTTRISYNYRHRETVASNVQRVNQCQPKSGIALH